MNNDDDDNNNNSNIIITAPKLALARSGPRSFTAARRPGALGPC